MANTDFIKNQIMALVSEGNADAAWEYAEAVREHLSEEELKEMEMWIAQNAYESFRSAQVGADGTRKWLQVAEHMKEGETLREAFPRLPGELQEFVRAEAKLAKPEKLH